MQDPNQADRQEILSGPGDARRDELNRPRRNRSTKNHKKATILAASALVALIAAGGAGYLLANANGEVAPQNGARPQTSQSAADDLQGDDEATMGDVNADEAAGDGAKDRAADAPADDGVGDVADPGVGGDPSGDRSGSENVATSRGESGNKASDGKKPASSPTKAPQSAGDGGQSDSPADGPAGLVPGQCSKSGC
ncbi:hypothetical protein ACFMQL_23700 [Nonomuraea fastidiosa]|jgi:hypothetical protein|uniref:hypothetical protein n=1 Tax=Nonomuraea TaxID=83681 RepID=UPI0034405E62